MPASLLSLKIRGVRSYSHKESKSQSIDFMPLTLIVGSNGHGKTTLIESLRFVISGEEPPLSDSRRNFLHTSRDPKASKFNEKKSYASIELEFQNSRDQVCLARREIYQPASSAKSATPSISSGYKIGSGSWNHVHKQADWSKTIPILFNLPSQAMLNNVILCHQEENLWCMGDSASVKQIFDKIFGCESYKKEINNISTEMKQCKHDLQISEKELAYQKEKIERKKSLMQEDTKLTAQVERMNREIEELELEAQTKSKDKEALNKKVMEITGKRTVLSSLKQRLSELIDKESELRKALREPIIDTHDVSIEDLEKNIIDQQSEVDKSKTDQHTLDYAIDLVTRKRDELSKKKVGLQREINILKVTELKSQDTLDSLTRQLSQIGAEQSITGLRSESLESSFQILEDFGKNLRQIKCDKSEEENKLSQEQQHLYRDISKLESTYSNLIHKIKSREKFIEKLTNQLEQSDPVAKDLMLVSENMDKISKIANVLPKSEQVESLKTIIIDSTNILSKLVFKVQNEGVMQLKSDILKEKSEIISFKESLKRVEEQKKDQSNQMNHIENEHAAIRTASKEAHNKMVTFYQALQNLKSSYSSYKNETKLLATKNMDYRVKEAESIDKGIADLENELSLLNIERPKVSDLLRQGYEKMQEFKTNIQVRQIQQQIATTQGNLKDLTEDIGDDSQHADLCEKLNMVDFNLCRLRDKRSILVGTKNQIAIQLGRIQTELDSLSRSHSKYSEILGRVVCNNIILKDLEKLKICFEKSIIAFHNQMIVKINEALRARWKQIYKGSDIKCIELVDEEIKRGNQKGFNYYIAMYKGSLKMKMREKSSAGQKALASIILRMTLAELFVKDFAFIALDEPTSNLDLDNVLSLAKTIGSYVKRRATKGTNIQWIIITHDEQFLRALDAECSPYYYRVELDDDGCSRIVKFSYQDAKLAIPDHSQEPSKS